MFSRLLGHITDIWFRLKPGVLRPTCKASVGIVSGGSTQACSYSASVVVRDSWIAVCIIREFGIASFLVIFQGLFRDSDSTDYYFVDWAQPYRQWSLTRAPSVTFQRSPSDFRAAASSRRNPKRGGLEGDRLATLRGRFGTPEVETHGHALGHVESLWWDPSPHLLRVR